MVSSFSSSRLPFRRFDELVVSIDVSQINILIFGSKNSSSKSNWENAKLEKKNQSNLNERKSSDESRP